jgi:hypothetical protein
LPGTLPYTDFFSESGDIIQGANRLDVHGPIFFNLYREVLPKMLLDLGGAFCAAKNAENFTKVMLRHFNWYASSCEKFIMEHVKYGPCRTNPSYKKIKNIYLMSWRLLSLIDYLMHKVCSDRHKHAI